MKIRVVNKQTILNRFVFHTLQRNITRLAVITRKINIKLGFLKGGTGKEPPDLISRLCRLKFLARLYNLGLNPDF